MTVYGADSASLRHAASQLDDEAGRFEQQAKTLTSSLSGLSWLGNVAVRFSDAWNSLHNPRMFKTATFLRDNATILRRQADEQDKASSGGNSTSLRPSPRVSPPVPAPLTGPKTAAFPAGRDWQEVQAKYDAWATGRFAAGGESHYQCTAWANYRWVELGYGGPPIGGDGIAMAGNAGGSTSTIPLPGAMASYGASNHVVIVEEVLDGGSRLRISEMNTGSDGSGWQVGNPQEFNDKRYLAKQPDGTWKVEGRGSVGAVTFANLPGS